MADSFKIQGVQGEFIDFTDLETVAELIVTMTLEPSDNTDVTNFLFSEAAEDNGIAGVLDGNDGLIYDGPPGNYVHVQCAEVEIAEGTIAPANTDLVVPVVPIILNVHTPPNQPTAKRLYEFGRAVRCAVETWDRNTRVAVIATGGLSVGIVDEELDRQALAGMQSRDIAALASLPRTWMQGSQGEVLCWIATAGAVEHLERHGGPDSPDVAGRIQNSGGMVLVEVGSVAVAEDVPRASAVLGVLGVLGGKCRCRSRCRQ